MTRWTSPIFDTFDLLCLGTLADRGPREHRHMAERSEGERGLHQPVRSMRGRKRHRGNRPEFGR